MGLLELLRFSFVCVDFLGWPVIALGYPLFASIRAVETGSEYRMRKLVIYWTLFSLFSLFEFAFAIIIERIPLWSSIRLLVIFWLVLPRFDGSCHAYQSLVSPVLSVNLRTVVDKLFKPKEERPCRGDAFLDVAEKYVKENGYEALEKLIATKMKEPDAPPHANETLEATKKSATEAEWLQVPDAAQLANQMLEVTRKSTTEVERVQYVLPKTAACDPVAGAKVNKTAPPETSAENRRPRTPPVERDQPKWTCDLCNVTTSSENTLNAHLQGSRHRFMCEYLKQSKLQSVEVGSSSSASEHNLETLSSENGQERVQFQQKLTKPKEDGGANHILKEMMPAETSAENRRPRTPPVKKVQTEWPCDLCKATTTSEKALNDHFQGSKHKSTCESLKQSKLHAVETVPSSSASKQGNPETVKNKGGKKSSKETQERVQFQKNQVTPKENGGAKYVWKEMTLPETSAENIPPRDPPVKKVPENIPPQDPPVKNPPVKKVPESIPPQNPPVKKVPENIPPQSPPVKKVQTEWTCDLCKVTTTSKKTLNAHLQGSKHKSNCESLKRSMPHAEKDRPSSSASKQSNPGALKNKDGHKSSVKTQEIAQYYYCGFCDAKVYSSIDWASHVRGKRHLSNIK